MKLKQWDWNTGKFIEIDYPDEIVREFVDFLRNSKSWWYGEEGLRIVHRRLQTMDEKLAEFRHNDGSKPVAAPVVAAPVEAAPAAATPKPRGALGRFVKAVTGG